MMDNIDRMLFDVAEIKKALKAQGIEIPVPVEEVEIPTLIEGEETNG